ncbi:breast cancer type 2 susceptibility [Phytophthora cinnamomi]|uniref:breast cancer type 2 susceptibility n=1 Tax=Phytophthora cinnamomi TaxID=4785 RepID=UPI0035595808|nr:breast cancer type 2 susceptibility [Phytophthora cinnamomi]
MVASLFTTGSGRAVSVSKERLQAYETKLRAAEEPVALSAVTQPAADGNVGVAGGRSGSGGSGSTMVASLFTTGSGRAVSVSKERLQAYETKLRAAEEPVALSAVTQPAADANVGVAGGRSGSGGSGSTMVASLFTTGSGRAVSVSKERLQAYETKLRAAEEPVALSAVTQPAADGNVGVAGGRSGSGGSGSTMVASLFTTGSGRAVSVSKERLQAYETKLCAAEEPVALNAITDAAAGSNGLEGDRGSAVDGDAVSLALGISTVRGSPSQSPSSSFAKELTQLKKYVERDILLMDFVPSQECNEHHVEVVEHERLTQDLQAHEEGGIASDEKDIGPNPHNRHLRWDGSVVKVLPLLGSNKFMFPRDVVAFASLNMKTDDKAFRTVYLTRELLITMKSLLEDAVTAPEHLCQKENDTSETDFALVQSVTHVLAEIKQRSANSTLRFEVRQSTNERLINSWKPWERLHASYWMAATVSTPLTPK